MVDRTNLMLLILVYFSINWVKDSEIVISETISCLNNLIEKNNNI
jgi:hypothetical protein